MSRWRKPIRPVPQRHKSLWRGCLFAFCAGWEKGFRGDGSLQTAAKEDVRQGRPTWAGSLSDENYTRVDMGRVNRSGVASFDKMRTSDINDYYDVPNGFMSAFIACRPSAIQNNEAPVFSKEPDAGPPSGWGITVSFAGDPNPNGWHFQIHDGGIKEFSVANEQNTGRSDVLVQSYNRSELVGYINGVRRGSIAATGSVTNNNVEVIIFGDGVTSHPGNFQGVASACAYWNRPLAAQEIQQLYSDPYVMWHEAHREFMFGPGAVPGAAGHGTYFLIF